MSDLPNWSDLSGEEKDAIIRPLWMDGKTASEITHYFVGASRNAVIGRVTRGKMGGRPAGPSRARAREGVARLNEGRATKAATRAKRLPMASPAFVSFVPDPEPIKSGAYNPVTDLRPPLDGFAPISILDLPMRSGGRCRFPVIGGYCGYHIGDDKVYCQMHSRIAYQARSENGSLEQRKR